jgi:hypothetical protein
LFFFFFFFFFFLCSQFLSLKPFFSQLNEESKIQLAYPGLVLLAGSILSLFYIGKKITFALATHLNNSVSFFLEGGCKLTSGEKVNNFKPQDSDDVVELNLYSPLYDDPILY